MSTFNPAHSTVTTKFPFLSILETMSMSDIFVSPSFYIWASLVAQVVKDPPAKAGDSRDVGSIPGLGRSPGEGNGNPFQDLAWRIPWTEEPGRLQPIALQRVGHDLANTCTHTYILYTSTYTSDFMM